MNRFFPILLLILAWASGCASAAKEVKPEPPAQAPSEPPEFVFGPGDVIQIKVWRHEDLDMEVKISPDGAISYPLIGRMKIAGMTYPKLMDLLRERISQYYVDPQVSINVKTVNSMKVYVLGEVKNPSILQIESEMNILEALTRTGGINEDAKTKNILLIRGGLQKPELRTINLNRLLAQGELGENIPLQKGDIVYVPTRTITRAERYFRQIAGILSPVVSGTIIYRNIETGGAQGVSRAE